MSESFARETINQLMEHNGPEETFANTERKLRQKIERLEEALRVIGGNNCITCSAEAFNALFAERHPRATLKGEQP